jgi:hypothetical protein
MKNLLILIIILAGIIPAYASSDSLLIELHSLDHKIFSSPEYFQYENYLEGMQQSKRGSKLESTYIQSMDAIFSRHPELEKMLLEQCDILYILKEKYGVSISNRSQGGC